jgi:aspartate kinase
MKFGGSSVADAERISGVAEIVRARMKQHPVVVVSALAGVTDLLEQAFDSARQGDLDSLEPLLSDLERRHRWALAGCIENATSRHHAGLETDRLFEDLRQRLRSIRILGEGTARARDAVLALGETLSSRIVAAALRDRALPATWLHSTDVMTTDDQFGDASPKPEQVRQACDARVRPLLEAGEVPVLGGFVGASESGDTTTLGRGGSDISAAVLGLALDADEIQIWTDVDGLMSADPKLVPAARTLPCVTFAEAAELALYGARVLHPDAIEPAVLQQIPVRVLNSRRPDGSGTWIVGQRRAEDAPVAVVSKGPVALVRLLSRRVPMAPGLPLRVLETCARAGIEPDLVLAAGSAVTLAVSRTERLAALESLGSEVTVETDLDRAVVCVVGVVGVGPGGIRGLRERVVAELASREPDVIAVGASGASIVAVLRQEVLSGSLRHLHQRFCEEESCR